MADTTVQIIDINDGDRISRLFKDVGNSQHAQAVVVVDSSGNSVNPGTGKAVALTPTVTAGAYAQYNTVGGKLTLSSVNAASGRPVKLNSIVLKTKTNIQPAVTFFFYKGDPSGTTWADKTTPTYTATDQANLVGVVQMVAGDGKQMFGATGPWAYDLSAINKVMAVTGTDLYLVIMADAAFTPGSTSEFYLEFDFEQL